MKIFNFRKGDLYVSEDQFEEFNKNGGAFKDLKKNAKFHFDQTFDGVFSQRPKFEEYFSMYGSVNKLNKKYAILNAHGNTDKKWIYFDGDEVHSVQSWINSVDGKYSGLLLCVCNPGMHTPKSRISPIVVPDHIVNFGNIKRDGIFSILEPDFLGMEEIDSYIIDYKVKELKQEFEEIKNGK
jgi:hypothetical protein